MKKPIRISHPPLVPRRLVILFSVCLTFIVMYAAFTTILHSKSTYHYNDPAMQQANNDILAYLNGADMALPFLTTAEQSHMADVKRMMDAAWVIYLCCLGIILGIAIVFLSQKMWQRYDELLGRGLRATGYAILVICFFCGAAALLNFERFWILFHVIFFPQGNWAFPVNSVLIELYPGSFFESFVLKWLLYVLGFAVVAIVLSFMMERMRHAEHSFSNINKPQNQKKAK